MKPPCMNDDGITPQRKKSRKSFTVDSSNKHKAKQPETAIIDNYCTYVSALYGLYLSYTADV